MTESSCSHPEIKRSYTIDGKWSICANCGESLIVVSDRENLLYGIFKARLMEEVNAVHEERTDQQAGFAVVKRIVSRLVQVE